jgi:hypothetical protein
VSRSRRRTRIHELGRPEVTEIEIGRTTHRVAKVEPMDLDGVRTMTIGTALWGFAVLALLPFLGRLESADHGWWFWTAVAGFGLGLVGIEYCLVRRNAIRNAANASSARGRHA